LEDGNKLMTVPISDEGRLNFGIARQLFESKFYHGSFPSYDVAADGRFVMTRPIAPEGSIQRRDRLTVVLNWLDELKRLVPTK
jgi:hypothetical protein